MLLLVSSTVAVAYSQQHCELLVAPTHTPLKTRPPVADRAPQAW